MSELRSSLSSFSALLVADPRPWALLGGLAVSTYVEPRFTRDIDLAISTSGDEAAEQFVQQLQSHGYVVSMVLEQTEQDRLATVRLVPPRGSADGVVIDLMFASSGIEAEICREAEHIEVFDGVIVPVCRPGHLLALKVLARDDVARPQDLVDIRALLARVDDEELLRAKRSVRLIEERGFGRGRDLVSNLERLISEQAGSGSR